MLPAAVVVAGGLAGVFGMASGAGAQTTSSAANASSTTTPTTAPSTASLNGAGASSSATSGTSSSTAASSTAASSTAASSTAAATATTSATGGLGSSAHLGLGKTALACQRSVNAISYPGGANAGSPKGSAFHICVNGQVTSYGNSAITYHVPPSSEIRAGEALFEQTCSSCHMANAEGGDAAPNLVGLSPATVDFWVSTGRMPAATPLSAEAERKPARLNQHQADEIAAWINSLSPAAPYIPKVNVKAANLADGASLFALNCAACHTITGAGDELAYGTNAPSLHIATARQVAEAIRIGPANMPRFTGNLSDSQVRDIVAYVTENIQHPDNPGGAGLGGIGPVAEGFVALLFGVGGFMLICFWIGDRS